MNDNLLIQKQKLHKTNKIFKETAELTQFYFILTNISHFLAVVKQTAFSP